MFQIVRLKKNVNYETLESALITAAAEVGLKIKVKDRYREIYELGSVEKAREYDSTVFMLRGRLLPAMEMQIYDKGPKNRFHICTGKSCEKHFGFASRRKVRQYLDAVSKYL